jgi:hypothetical protein
MQNRIHNCKLGEIKLTRGALFASTTALVHYGEYRGICNLCPRTGGCRNCNERWNGLCKYQPRSHKIADRTTFGNAGCDSLCTIYRAASAKTDNGVTMLRSINLRPFIYKRGIRIRADFSKMNIPYATCI